MYSRKYFNKEFDRNKIEEKNNDPFNLSYHISPITGWLNDPNGLCQVDGTYHIYYQADPLNAIRKNIIWGHVTTKDFINYNYHEPFIFADTNLDKDGAYSGSAFLKDNKINFFYTGNVKYPGNYDYINDGRDHNTIKIVSEDGFSYDKKELILSNDDYPRNLTRHVRDPKIYEEDGIYYLFLGARDRNDKGKVIVYESKDLEKFSYHMEITTNYDFGYMWECPDFFEINGNKFLMISPQGLESEEFKYQNIYQSGYFPIDIDLKAKVYRIGEFVELDYGFDFYAPQTFEDEKGRRILIGWMGMPDANYTNPTVKNNWQHALTLPRELKVSDNKLLQKPIKEIENLRNKKIQIVKNENYFYQTFEFISEDIDGEFEIYSRSDAKLSYKDQILSLNLGQCGYGRDKRKIRIEKIDNISIYSDTSSVEIFINDGQYVMTSRVYSEKSLFKSSIIGTLYEMDNIKWEKKLFE
ncbi:glycoside hydrolase family 32 protein [Anaerococcus provencensis]|uniref:glycoside hydrolase family 32 protein n=1 Tax=Anaerococcus provencensis TaxID=938293 RepID=UPI0005CA697B|nr:glycoside hydrolase family 32 protein [Anaerococcus provencensis]